MKPTKEHLKKKNGNLILTSILFILQISIIGICLYFLGGEVNIYGNIAFIFFILGIPNLVFISMNIVMLFRGEYIRFRYNGPPSEKIHFINNPQEFLKNTFPTDSIVLILMAFLLSLYLLTK